MVMISLMFGRQLVAVRDARLGNRHAHQNERDLFRGAVPLSSDSIKVNQ